MIDIPLGTWFRSEPLIINFLWKIATPTHFTTREHFGWQFNNRFKNYKENNDSVTKGATKPCPFITNQHPFNRITFPLPSMSTSPKSILWNPTKLYKEYIVSLSLVFFVFLFLSFYATHTHALIFCLYLNISR